MRNRSLGRALLQYWRAQYEDEDEVLLSFLMIKNRLVDLLLRENPIIRKALNCTSQSCSSTNSKTRHAPNSRFCTPRSMAVMPYLPPWAMRSSRRAPSTSSIRSRSPQPTIRPLHVPSMRRRFVRPSTRSSPPHGRRGGGGGGWVVEVGVVKWGVGWRMMMMDGGGGVCVWVCVCVLCVCV